MAEITFDKFWGGMSPTSLYAKAGQCSYLEGVSVKQNVSKVVNESLWQKKFLTDGNDMTVHFTATGSITSREWYAGEGGQIYIDTASDNVPTKQLTDTGLILDHTSILGGIFLIQKTGSYVVSIHRMDEENASNGSLGDFNENLWSNVDDGIAWDSDNTHITSFGEASIIAVKGSKLYWLNIVDDAGEVGGYNLSLNAEVDIGRAVVGLSTTTDFIKIYTKDGRILMYNKNRTLVSETFTGELFHRAVTVNNLDYVVGEDGLYYVKGNTLADVLIDGDKGIYSISNNREIYVWRKNIYLNVDFDGEVKLLEIGTSNAGFPIAMTLLPTKDVGGNSVLQYYGTGGRFNLSAGLNVSTTGKGIYSLSGSKTNSEGIVMTEKFNDGSQLSTKEIQEIIVSGKFSDGSTIETIINDDETSTPVLLDNGDDKTKVIRTNAFNNLFLDCVIKIVLKGTDQLYGIKLKYNDEMK